MHIIRLSPHRWQEYKELRIRSVHEEPLSFARTCEEEQQIPDSEWEKRLRDAQLPKPNTNYYFFVEHEGILVGFIGALLTPYVKECHKAHIVNFYVIPHLRKHGIGNLLFKHLLSVLSMDERIVQLTLHVTSSLKSTQALYKAHGFKTVGLLEKNIYVNGDFVDQYLMIKIIK